MKRIVNIGLAPVNQTVGDFSGNTKRILSVIEKAKNGGAHILVLPELAISGYSLGDLVRQEYIMRKSWECLEEIVGNVDDSLVAFVGLPVRHREYGILNVAAVISGKGILGFVVKNHLPEYSVFYEKRNFSSPEADAVFEIENPVNSKERYPAGKLIFDVDIKDVGNVKIAGEICEDMWSASPPFTDSALAGAQIICNLSASNFVVGKHEVRKRMIIERSHQLLCVYAYVSMLGLDDARLIFDGDVLAAICGELVSNSCCDSRFSRDDDRVLFFAADINKVIAARMANTTWRHTVASGDTERCKVIRIELNANLGVFDERDALKVTQPWPCRNDRTDLIYAITIGIADYFRKVGTFKKFLVALSGGKDSALVLLLVIEAVRRLYPYEWEEKTKEMVLAYSLPTQYNSDKTKNAARNLALALGVDFKEISIEQVFGTVKNMMPGLLGGKSFDQLSDVAAQNIQPRIRSLLMLLVSNEEQALFLGTSNMSEMAVGYFTAGGDNQGGLAPISGITKGRVEQLLSSFRAQYIPDRLNQRWANNECAKAISDIIKLEPSAELKEDQKDETDLMPYEVLDWYLFKITATEFSSLDDVLDEAETKLKKFGDRDKLKAWLKKFLVLLARTQWKREQCPVGFKLENICLDPTTDFRWPVLPVISMLEELEK